MRFLRAGDRGRCATRKIGAALAFKAGELPVETALQTALIAAICLKFDEQLKSRPRAS